MEIMQARGHVAAQSPKMKKRPDAVGTFFPAKKHVVVFRSSISRPDRIRRMQPHTVGVVRRDPSTPALLQGHAGGRHGEVDKDYPPAGPPS
jgi:hypothetical protein